MDGFEICHCLKSNPGTASLLVLMFSAKAQETDRNTGLKAGADDYLTKPAAPAEIVSRVARLLTKKGSSSPAIEKVRG
jgi:DNA-binding response OmpR family regulator